MTAALPGPERVLSRDIMERLRQQAALLPRPQVRLSTLHRLEEACDDIASGRARELATKMGMDDAPFGLPKRPKIDSRSIHHYVRIRAKMDATDRTSGPSEWKGPHDVTIRADREGMAVYVTARHAEAVGLLKPRPLRTRARRAQEIVAGIVDNNDRLLLMDVVEDAYTTAKRYSILVAALRTLPNVDVDALIDPKRVRNEPGEAEVLSSLGPQERRILHGLMLRLTDAGQLLPFGLRFDGRRIRMSMAPGTELVTKVELDLLRTLSMFEI